MNFACRRGGSKHGCSKRVSVNCKQRASASERHESGLHRLRSKRPRRRTIEADRPLYRRADGGRGRRAAARHANSLPAPDSR